MKNPERVLFPTDFSEVSSAALPHAAKLAKAFGAELHVLHVEVLHDYHPIAEERFPRFEEYEQALETYIGELFDSLLSQATVAELDVQRAHRRDVSAAPAIVRYVEETGIDLVVMATHGYRGLRHLFLGSVAEEVVRSAQCPVLTVRAEPGVETAGAGPILVPIDFSERSAAALDAAASFARETGSVVELLHAVELSSAPLIYEAYAPAVPLPSFEELASEARTRLAKLRDEAGLDPESTKITVLEGSARQVILRRIEELKPSLAIQASAGSTAAARILLGSVAEWVVNRSPCPVLTMKVAGGRGDGSEEE